MQNVFSRLEVIAWFVLGFVFLICLPVVMALPWWLIAVLVLLGLALALPAFLGLRARARRHIWGEYPSYLRCALATLMVLGIVVGTPVYYLSYQVDVKPVLMPTVTLSDGQRTIIFQGMQHVGSENFYKGVVYDLENALSQGYRLYYEGVQPGTPESDKWFSDTLAGGGDLSAHYRSMAEACGMKFQLDYFSPLVADIKAHPERHLTADVTTAQMKQEYDRLLATDAAFAAAMKASSEENKKQERQLDDFLTGMIKWQESSTPDQRYLAGVICRGFFNVVLGTQPDSGPLDPVILDFRNRHLVDTLMSDSSPHIYITYGTHHLPGVLALLKEKAPTLQLKSVKWQRSMAAPEHFNHAL